MLLSPDALDSDYFYEVESPIALRRHQAGEAITVGVLLRPCDLKYTPFGDLTRYELLPKKGYPISDPKWADRDEAYLSIFREVDTLVEKIEDVRNGGKAKLGISPSDLIARNKSPLEQIDDNEQARLAGKRLARELTRELLKPFGTKSIDPK